MAEVDVKRIVGEMASKHGIRLDTNDPAISLVLLNRLVLEHSADDLVAGIARACTISRKLSGKCKRGPGSL